MLVSGAGTFLLGVGCQKGGTAWLHRYLEASPQCDPGFRKEYHVWDALDLPAGRLARERIEKQGGRRAAFLDDPDRYFDYFSGLLEPPGIRLTADITPGLRRALGRAAGDDPGRASRRAASGPAAVYLLRDPVERIWSAARMDMRRRGDEAPEDPETRVSHMYKHPMYADRTRYDLTMDALEAGVPARGRLLRLLRAAVLRRDPGAAVRLPRHRLPRARHRPAGQRLPEVQGAALPEETRRTIARHFAPVYDAVQRRFPDLDLAELWPSMRLL